MGTSKIKDFNWAVCNFYNEFCAENVTDYTEIPDDNLEILMDMEYSDLIRPFLRRDIKEGKASERGMAIKYRVSRQVVQWEKMKIKN